MRLEDYWGIGPKTSDRLTEALGTERAVEAIESADVRALVDAGLVDGRKDGRWKMYRATNRAVTLITVLEGSVDVDE